MDITEKLLEETALATNGVTKVTARENEIDFKAPYKRISMYDAIKEHTGFDISQMDEEQLRAVCRSLHIDVDDSMGKGKLVDEIFSEKCEASFYSANFYY